MRRRELLAAVGGLGGAGCLGRSEGSGGATATVATTTATTATPEEDTPEQQSYNFDVGHTVEFSDGVEITVTTLTVANELVFQNSDVRSPSEGTVFVLAHVRTRNTAEVVRNLPEPSRFVLVTGGQQSWRTLGCDTYWPARLCRSGLEKPVSGSLYFDVMEARPGVTTAGWFVFEAPSTANDVEVSWAAGAGGKPVNWQATIDTDGLPQLSVEGVSSPETAEIGEKFIFEITVRNSGGGRGTYRGEYQASAPTHREVRNSFTLDVPPNSTAAKRLSLVPRAMGTATVTVPDVEGATASTEIQPARFRFGERLTTAIGLEFEVDDPTFADQIEYVTIDGEEGTADAPEGRQFLLVRVAYADDTDDWGPPERWQFTVESGHDEYPAKTVTFWGDPVNFEEPVEAPEYDAPGQVPGYALFEVPEDFGLSDFDFQIAWSPTYGTDALAEWSVDGE